MSMERAEEIVAQGGIEDESAYVAAARALEHQARPPYVLRLLMRGLEGYRSQRKMGWSRPQNKKGVCTYRSYSLDPISDAQIVQSALSCVRAEFSTMPHEQAAFVSELMADPSLMGFIFCQDLVEADACFETVTVSFGRVSAVSRRFRDRFDVILDSRVSGRRREHLSRVRVFVDPFRQPIGDHAPWSDVVERPSIAATALLADLAAFDQRHMADVEKRWHHWTSRYVEYFGPRSRALQGTLFPDEVDLVAQPLALKGAERRQPGALQVGQVR